MADNGGMEQRRIAMLIGGIALLALLVTAALLSTRTPTELDPTTPEGVAQAFMQAAFDKDIEAMESYLTPDTAQNCTIDPFFLRENPSRAAIADTVISASRATVVVDVTHSSGESPFELSEWTMEVVLVMTQSDDGWRIDEHTWPVICEEGMSP